MKLTDKLDQRIGKLLVDSQVLTSQDLKEAIKLSQNTSLPIGRVLVMSGFVYEREFLAAVQLQSMVKDLVLPFNAATKALSLVSSAELSLEEALHQVGFEDSEEAITNRLGELLLEAQIVNKQHLDTAMRTCQSTGLPLGRILVSLGVLSDEVLATALNTQVLIRDGKLTRDQAIKGLRSAYQRRRPVEMSLSGQGFYRSPHRPSIRLGELFVLSEILSEDDVMNCLQQSLLKEQPLGKALVQHGLVSAQLLEVALKLQEMVANETLSDVEASECLAKFHNTGRSLEEILSLIEVSQEEFKAKLRLHEILRIAGVVQQKDIEQLSIEKSVKPSSLDAQQMAKALFKSGVIDERTMYGALRCYFLIATGWLNVQQGIIALNYFFLHPPLNFDEVLYDLSWTVGINRDPADMQMAKSHPN